MSIEYPRQEMIDEKPATLKIPKIGEITCSRDFIQTAVCELRIPTVLELDSTPPQKFAKAIKREYPVYSPSKDVAVNFGSSPYTSTRHTFTDRKQRWVVTFKSSAITLETAHYQGFEDFHARLMHIVSASKEERDSDFFVRAGLRYINVLPVGQEDLDGWINKDLAPPLLDGTFGSVTEFWQSVRGSTESGGYTLRHGLKEIAPRQPGAERGSINYALDMDFYRDDVEENEVGTLLQSLHSEAFRLFAWAVDEKARHYMGWKQIGKSEDV